MVLPDVKAKPRTPSRASKGAAAKRNEPADYDEKLFDALRAWRRDMATAIKGSACVTHPDRTLQELATR